MTPSEGERPEKISERTFVVIPAFNEDRVIADVLKEVLGVYPDVILVDDGSTDRTAEIAFEAGAQVLRHPFNLGQGAALQTGIDYAIRNGASLIVTFDADGQHEVGDVATMIGLLERNDADVVLGSRFLGRTDGLARSKRLLLKGAILFTNATSGLRLTDTHNGLRVMRARAARRIRLTQNGMAHASELLHQIAALRLRFIEAPVTVRYSAYSAAKGQAVTGALSILYDLFYARISK